MNWDKFIAMFKKCKVDNGFSMYKSKENFELPKDFSLIDGNIACAPNKMALFTRVKNEAVLLIADTEEAFYNLLECKF